MSIFIRTVPNVMQHFNCTAEDAQRYIDLRDEGHGREQAALMAGLSDPPEPRAPGVPASGESLPWQERVGQRNAFERGVSAMRDVAVTVIRARHESGYSCDPWKLVEAIRAAKEPTDPCGVPAWRVYQHDPGCFSVARTNGSDLEYATDKNLTRVEAEQRCAALNGGAKEVPDAG